MKTFKTPKGTELPIMDIKGKDYLQAAPRIFWMKEEHPEWGIETELLNFSEKHATFRATIRDGAGKILAQATSMETLAGFESFLEKAETCAVSRAAAFCGYGTLMAQELEEQERDAGRMKLAESPNDPKGPRLQAVPSDPMPSFPSPQNSHFASDAQVKRLTAIQLKAKVPDSVLKTLAASLGINSRNEIPKDKYALLCTLVETYKP